MNPATERTCLVAIATYNELENLPALVDQILAAAGDARILVMDDNSPDGTGRWAEQRSKADARLDCVVRPGKMGLGTASVDCIRYAIEHGFDLLVTMDADFSHHPRYLPSLLRPFEESQDVDVVIGSRYVPGGHVDGWPWHRHIMSRAINWCARTLLRIPARDCSGAFRCYQVDTLKKLQLDEIESRGFSYFEEVLWRLARQGASITEVPIVFVDRAAGSTKMNLRESISAIWMLLRLALRSQFHE